jgi:CRISPR system Cascade subunit CasA
MLTPANLLTASWIPVSHEGKAQRISLKTLLCTETPWEITLPRDDMELAALQLLICLVQVIFPPANDKELRHRIAQPLDESTYDTAVVPYLEWFDLDHPTTPFMQTRGVAAADVTPIQKLFVGLPEGSNHSFFDPEGVIESVCPGCTAIAMFNQASCCPSFGGGFKGTLRGNAPVTTLMDAPHLRRRIWENVLPVSAQATWRQAGRNLPTWLDPIRAGEKIPAIEIGLTRGLFWQPAKLELIPNKKSGVCDSCGHESDRTYSGFNKEQFNYIVEGIWRHPHSPMLWNVKKGEVERRYVSFTTTAPAWTQLTQYLPRISNDDKEGHEPATVIVQYRCRSTEGTTSVGLIIGGYRNNQASILERRHELFSFRPGWEYGIEDLNECVQIALNARGALYKSLMWAAKGQKDKFKGIGVDLHKTAERAFYDRSESFIHERLRVFDFESADREKEALRIHVNQLALDLYNESVTPYTHDVGLVQAIAAGRRKLLKELNS